LGNIIGIIPARGGSVRVPLKNIKSLNGKPLIQYTIEAALEAGVLDRVIVSTDHDEIAKVAIECGAEVPFRRPSDISEDVDTEYVLQHAVQFLEEQGYKVDAVVLLQPTSPLRTAETIKKCVELYRTNKKADSVVTVNNIEGFRPEWMLSLGEENKVIPYSTPFLHNGEPVIKLAARQSFPVLYKQNGLVYVVKKELLMQETLCIGPSAFAVETDDEEALDIDTPTDFLVVETILKSRKR
jgi:CMP-N-acetylneuraminic acid synthetase